jgi:hypothetical protein
MMKNYQEKIYIEETPESIRCPYTYVTVQRMRWASDPTARTTEAVVINDCYAKTEVWEGAEQLLIQLAAFALVVNIFRRLIE